MRRKNVWRWVCAISFFIFFYPFLSFSQTDSKEDALSSSYETAPNAEQEAKENEEISWQDYSESPAAAPAAEGATPEPRIETKDVNYQDRLKEIVSVAFKDTDLKQALSVLAENYELNILAGDDVKGSITINFKDVPLSDVLTQMLKLKNFTYVWEGNVIKILSAEEAIETRKFYVSHITLDLAKEVIMDKISKDGKVRINTATNQLIITDTITKLDVIEKILTDVDTPPEQVRIETKLIDISHTDLDNLGLKWETANFNFKVPWGITEKKTVIDQLDYTNEGTSSTLSGGQYVIGFEQGGATLDATIDALIRYNKARVIANPSITTLNNVEARITIGTKYPIREQTQTSTGTLETTRFVDVGTTLKVTPKISRDGTVQLTIHPEVSSVSTTVDAGPVITTREADTTVIVNDRETLIIAGLLQTNDDVNKSRIPFLGSIPIIGALFSSRDKDKEQKELVIFMTPHVLKTSGKTVYATNPSVPSEIDLAGERVNAIELFDKAQDLEKGESLQMRVFPVGVRMAEAAKLYERISIIFPNNYYAEIGLYRAGRIYETQLKDYDAAMSCYNKILESYPRSSYAADTKKRVDRFNKKKN